MEQVFGTIAPGFSIIALGWLVAHFRLLADETGKGLSDFVFAVAMPALLIRTQVVSDPVTDAPVATLASFFIACAITWAVASLVNTQVLGRPAKESAAFAMASAFGNTVMLGFPLGISYFGERSAGLLALIIALHAPSLWLVATLQQEWVERGGGLPSGRALLDLVVGLTLNPVVLAVVVGALWRGTGLGITPVLDKIMQMLGAAAVPGALFALGMTLTRFQIRGQGIGAASISALKLLLFPVLAWLLSTQVFALPQFATQVVVLLAACPTGANAYLFANRYGQSVTTVSGSVALGTAISVVTISALLLML